MKWRKFTVVLDGSVLGSEIENCNPVEEEEATSGTVVLGLLVGCKGEAGVSSGEAGLEGIFAGAEIGDRKVTTEVVGRSKPEGVGGWKSSSGSNLQVAYYHNHNIYDEFKK